MAGPVDHGAYSGIPALAVLVEFARNPGHGNCADGSTQTEKCRLAGIRVGIYESAEIGAVDQWNERIDQVKMVTEDGAKNNWIAQVINGRAV
jgi:hypothetical protein